MHASNIDDCQRLYQLIDKFDANGDGVLNMKEFEQFLKS
jgi:Ca2+-binding EF-hand superfamily protein